MGIWTKETEYGTELRWGRIVVSAFLILVSLITVLSSIGTVPAGHRGVVLYLGAVENRVLSEGFYTITPYLEHVVITEVRTQKYEVKASAATKDLLDVSTTVAINFHINPSGVNILYQEIGTDYENRMIAPAVQETVKATTAKFNAEHLITQRPLVKQEIETALRDRLRDRDILIETISLTDFQFPASFNEAITAKQVAVQLKLKAENDLERIKVEAEQAIASARGQSESIRIINEQLQKSPQYIEYLAVQRWNGVMPLVTGSGGMPLISVPTGKN